MFTEHLYDLRMVLLFNAKLLVLCADGFVRVTDGAFSTVIQIPVYEVYVTTRFVSVGIKGFCFHDAKHFTMREDNFKGRYGMVCCFCHSLAFH